MTGTYGKYSPCAPEIDVQPNERKKHQTEVSIPENNLLVLFRGSVEIKLVILP